MEILETGLNWNTYALALRCLSSIKKKKLKFPELALRPQLMISDLGLVGGYFPGLYIFFALVLLVYFALL